MKASIISIFVRLFSIGTKFLLLIYLAKILTIEDYGQFQLILYITLIGIYLFGMEYYNISNREYVKNSNIIYEHISFIITILPIMIIILYLISSIVFKVSILSFFFLSTVVFIAFFEYVSQEVFRYLIISQNITKANVLLFLKSFILILFIIIYNQFYKVISLNILITLFLFSNFIIFLISIKWLFKNIAKGISLNLSLLNIGKIKDIFVSIYPFIFSTLILKGVEFGDKLILNHYFGSSIIGIYGLLYSIASILTVLVVSGFYLIFLPKLIKIRHDNIIQFKGMFIQFALYTICATIIGAIILYFGQNLIYNIIGKTIYFQYSEQLLFLIISFTFLNLSLIANMLIYIEKLDKYNLNISIIVFITYILLNLYLIPLYSINGAIISLVSANVLNFILKFVKSKQIWNNL